MNSQLLAATLTCFLFLVSSSSIRSENPAATTPADAKLIEQLKNGEPATRKFAVQALIPDWMNPAVLQALTDTAEKDEATEVRYAAVSALGRSKGAEKALIAALNDKDQSTRFLAAIFLAKAGVFDDRIPVLLVEALGGRYAWTEHSPQEAKLALMRMKQSPVKQLIIAVGGNNQQVLWLASEALGGRGKEAAEAVPALTRLLDHQEISVRLAAVGALGYIGSPASDALAALRKLAGSDPSPAIKERAAKSIELIAADITKPTN